jgi:hypothetical protein
MVEIEYPLRLGISTQSRVFSQQQWIIVRYGGPPRSSTLYGVFLRTAETEIFTAFGRFIRQALRCVWFPCPSSSIAKSCTGLKKVAKRKCLSHVAMFAVTVLDV